MVLSRARVDWGKFSSFQKKDAVLPGQSSKHLILQCLFPLRPERSVSFVLFQKAFLVSVLVSLLPKVCGSVAAVEERLRGQATSLPCGGLSESTGASSNIPEETDDVDNSSLDAASSLRAAPQSGVSASPAPAEDGEGRVPASGGMRADSSSDACTSPEPPQAGKCVGI